MVRRNDGIGARTRASGARALAVIGALLALLGGLLVGTSSAEASVIPMHGSYSGVDHGGRAVSFTFSGNQMSHFMVGSLTIGGAHVSNGMWHETCHNGYCTKGSWTTDGHVSGYWRHGGSSSWVHWTAQAQQPTPYHGPYMGRDHHGTSIHFHYGNGRVTSFQVGHTFYGDVSVSNGQFSACQHGICFQGHWQNRTTVTGHWRHHNSSTWIPWEVWAYAA